jgi:hypothetical protein
MGKANEKAWHDFTSNPGLDEATDLERKDFIFKYLLDRVEELAVKVYALTNENADLSRQLMVWNSLENVRELKSQLATVTTERDALKAQLDAKGNGIGCAIWWLSQKDCEIISDLPDPDDDYDFGPYLPAYICKEYISLRGRNGRGRLWVSKSLAMSGDTIISEYLFEAGIGKFLAEDYGGIVILGDDAKYVACFPGIVTDMDLNYWTLP